MRERVPANFARPRAPRFTFNCLKVSRLFQRVSRALFLSARALVLSLPSARRRRADGVRLRDGDAAYSVAARDAVNHVHAFDHSTEDRVAAVEVWLRRVRDEPLRAARVLARQGHADRAATVRNHIYLAANLVAGAAVAVAARVAALYDEVRHDAVERDAVEVVPARKPYEVVNRQRRVLRQQLNRERALVRRDDGANIFSDARGGALVVRPVVARVDGLDAARARRSPARALAQNVRRSSADEVVRSFERLLQGVGRLRALLLRERADDGERGVVHLVLQRARQGRGERARVVGIGWHLREYVRGCRANDNVVGLQLLARGRGEVCRFERLQRAQQVGHGERGRVLALDERAQSNLRVGLQAHHAVADLRARHVRHLSQALPDCRDLLPGDARIFERRDVRNEVRDRAVALVLRGRDARERRLDFGRDEARVSRLP